MMLWGSFSEITFLSLNDRSRIQMCTQVLSSNGNSRRLKIKQKKSTFLSPQRFQTLKICFGKTYARALVGLIVRLWLV